MSLVSNLKKLPPPGSPYWASVRAELAAAVPLVRDVAPTLLRAAFLPNQTLLTRALENAKQSPDALAFEQGDERLTWKQLDALTSKYAHILAESGVRAGDNIVLMARNSPRFLAWVLAASRVGATAALINFHLTGAPLAHALRTSKARVAIVEQPFVASVDGSNLREGGKILSFGFPGGDVEKALSRASDRAFTPARRTGDDDFVYIYTSGTTGLPKPCRISHTRSMLAATIFGAVALELRPDDKIYAPLPLYHASALLIGAGSAIMRRVPLATRESFSANQFLTDVQRYDASVLVYIGEVCRYLVSIPERPDDARNRLRIAIGNGLRPDVWEPFQKRYGIAMIREFYTATESPGALLNWAGVPGSVGRLPFRGFGWLKLAKFDVDSEDYVRDANGFLVEAGPDEPGELLVRIPSSKIIKGMEFRGYTDEKATNSKVLTDAFKKGDRYFRSGDLLRQDKLGFYSFVDRIGDTYRCKGENVSTAEVADVLGAVPGIVETAVVGVRFPGYDGQFGLAAVVPNEAFDPDAFTSVSRTLPAYAQPRFVRVMKTVATTSTHKHQKSALKKEGADPSTVTDPLYFRTDSGAFVPLTGDVYKDIVEGRARL